MQTEKKLSDPFEPWCIENEFDSVVEFITFLMYDEIYFCPLYLLGRDSNFILLTNGTFCSTVKYQISTVDECLLASQMIGLRWGGSRNKNDEAPACYLAINVNKVYFNLSPSTNFPTDNAQICRRARRKKTSQKFNHLFNYHY